MTAHRPIAEMAVADPLDDELLRPRPAVGIVLAATFLLIAASGIAALVSLIYWVIR